jgi:hypothetical protein
MNDTKVGLDQTLECSLTRITTNKKSIHPIDDCSVFGLCNFHQLVVHAQRNNMGCLSIRINLAICEFVLVVDERRGAGGKADVARNKGWVLRFFVGRFRLEQVRQQRKATFMSGMTGVHELVRV